MKLSDINIRDPFMYVENDTCYLLGTTDKNAWNGKAFGFQCYKSSDLINFEGPYTLFQSSLEFWADENYWAPELHRIDSHYVLLASFHKQGLHRVSQALVSDNILGPYVPTSTPFTPKEWDCLDATYYNENNKKYIIFCHEWTQIHNGEICIGEINNDLTKLFNIKLLFKGSDAKWVTPIDIDRTNYVTDGPFIYKMKDNCLIMLWSSFSKNGYAVGMAKSRNGINGKWIQSDIPLIDGDIGHAMIFNYKNETYLIAHNNNNKQSFERPVIYKVFEKDGWLQLK